jgi:glycosyltransferase involved in cell wall biosynthesis
MIKMLEERGVPRNRTAYVPNCVDLEFFKPKTGPDVAEFRHRLGIAPGKLLFGYLGRMHPWQGVEQFIAAAREHNDSNAAFVIVGNNETKTEGNLHFAGKVPLAAMRDFYSICDVCVLPRPSHPATEVAAPTKFAEYASMGKPIIATEVGDAPDFIREYGCGVVVANNSPAELIRGFRWMQEFDDGQRSAMGWEARRLAETEFNLDIAGKNLSACIEGLTVINP